MVCLFDRPFGTLADPTAKSSFMSDTVQNHCACMASCARVVLIFAPRDTPEVPRPERPLVPGFFLWVSQAAGCIFASTRFQAERAAGRMSCQVGSSSRLLWL